jgi:hypothetical protein
MLRLIESLDAGAEGDVLDAVKGEGKGSMVWS